MKFIRELSESVEYLIEKNEEGKKFHSIHGIFMQAECQNRNGRIYPKAVLESEMTRYKKEVVDTKRGFGELGHPQGPTINLDRVSHVIRDLKCEGNNFYGRAQITETPMGNIVKGLLESDARLGVSSRALGSLKENDEGIMEVQDDLRLITVDIVADPSAPDAFVDGIMENVDWVLGPGGTWERHVEEAKKEVKKMNISEINEKKAALFEAFISKLIQ